MQLCVCVCVCARLLNTSLVLLCFERATLSFHSSEPDSNRCSRPVFVESSRVELPVGGAGGCVEEGVAVGSKLDTYRMEMA